MMRSLRAEQVTEHGTVQRVASQLGYGVESVWIWVKQADIDDGTLAPSTSAVSDAALDEIGNLVPLPSLPMLMTEGGGTEITTMPVLQSLAHAREKWSNNATETIWDASIVKIILSSTPNSLDLQNLTTQRSIRRMAIMPADVIHTLAIGTGVILLRAATPIVAKLCAWMRRRDNSELRAQRAVVEESLRQRP